MHTIADEQTMDNIHNLKW